MTYKLGLIFVLMLAGTSSAAKRCDWHGPKSKGESTYKQCVDYAALNGTVQTLPKNVTRISADGISFCPGVTPSGTGNADIVFIYDNSGSMKPGLAYVDAAKNDTIFYYKISDNNHPCNDNPTKGSLTYKTLVSNRTLPFLTSKSGCDSLLAGDPYYARGKAIETAIDYLSINSPTSTAGAIAFNDDTDHEQKPLIMNIAKNVSDVKARIVLDSSGGTHYIPPLDTAIKWLKNPNIIKTKQQAIIFISDGAPKDKDPSFDEYLAGLDKSIPVYSIYLGDAFTPDTVKLKALSTKTGGTFNRVDPRNVASINQVMKGILQTITTVTIPKAVTVSNSSLTPPQSSHSIGVVANPDGSQGVTLDSIIALNTGANKIEIKLTRDDNSVVNYNFTLDVSGAEIGSSGGTYSCYDMPTLTAVDNAGKPLEIYSQEATEHTLKLTHAPSTDLQNVTVGAAADGGDTEGIAMGNANMDLGFPVHTSKFKLNPQDPTPTPGNGTVEADNKGNLTFTWTHPRDARETVTYILPGKLVPVLDGAVVVKLKDAVTTGEAFAPIKLATPMVVVDASNRCLANCQGTDAFWSNPSIPTWVTTIKSPVTYTIKLYDNIGQFVAAGKGEISQVAWEGLAKAGDSAVIQLKLPPLSRDGQQLGTGAYLLKAEITALGNLVTKSSNGDLIVVKNSKKEFLSKFGYVRR